jgi:hypothetical protein
VGCVEHINLTGEIINTDEWAGINMPDDVTALPLETEILWDVEPMGDRTLEKSAPPHSRQEQQERRAFRKRDPRMTPRAEEFWWESPRDRKVDLGKRRFRQVNRRKRSRVAHAIGVVIPWLAFGIIVYALVSAIR